eukprot:TRINITY_DN2500_c0_g2_i1.p1 TRINITY_DN2500_c0_g2~~TRINITY_DN2500_c0_g2_i1.p1  ORF type:complete len:233 (-),score=47.15 TRINITY_DN2500_c0_g2_i1:90-788(-)
MQSTITRLTLLKSLTRTRRTFSMGSVFGVISEETARFDSVQTTEIYEIRKYHRCVIAETKYSTDEDAGFWALAGYIGAVSAPQNTARQGIAMTAPVVTKGEPIAMTAPVVTSKPEPIAMTVPVVQQETKGEQNDETMAFILPSKFQSIEDCPVPTNQNVFLKVLPERYSAVHRFYGYTDMKRCQTQVKLLQEALDRDGVKIAGQWQLARFNGPFTIYPLRTNEVSFPVEYIE